MNALRTFAAVAALGTVALAAQPALAQGWSGDGYGPGWHEGYAPAYGYGPYGPGGYGPYGYGVQSGEADIAICPPHYHLGRSARLCWPDR